MPLQKALDKYTYMHVFNLQELDSILRPFVKAPGAKTLWYMLMIRKIALIGLCSLLLVGCDDLPFAANAKEPEEDPFARPAKIETARKMSFSLYKTFPGVTEASRNSVLAFRVSGQITDLPVRAGQVLNKGQLIAQLDETPYLNVVADRQARFDLSKTQLERTKSLFAKKHVAKAALDAAKSNFAAAEAALKTAKDNLGYTRLVAPYDGVVARIDVERFQNVQAFTPAFNFQGNKDIDISFSVPERLFLAFEPSKAALNPHFDVTFDAMPNRLFKAYYKEHDSVPDKVTRAFKVTVTMPRPDKITVLPGMSVNVRIDVAKVTNIDTTEGVLVPTESVFEEAGKRWVWKVTEDNVTHKTEVSVMGIEEGGIRLSEGLQDGDRVIAVGTSFVTEGMKVRAYAKERGL